MRWVLPRRGHHAGVLPARRDSSIVTSPSYEHHAGADAVFVDKCCNFLALACLALQSRTQGCAMPAMQDVSLRLASTVDARRRRRKLLTERISNLPVTASRPFCSRTGLLLSAQFKFSIYKAFCYKAWQQALGCLGTQRCKCVPADWDASACAGIPAEQIFCVCLHTKPGVCASIR